MVAAAACLSPHSANRTPTPSPASSLPQHLESVSLPSFLPLLRTPTRPAPWPNTHRSIPHPPCPTHPVPPNPPSHPPTPPHPTPQVVDDILDFTQSSEALGKPQGQDLASGNLTAPVLFALQVRWRGDGGGQGMGGGLRGSFGTVEGGTVPWQCNAAGLLVAFSCLRQGPILAAQSREAWDGVKTTGSPKRLTLCARALLAPPQDSLAGPQLLDLIRSRFRDEASLQQALLLVNQGGGIARWA